MRMLRQSTEITNAYIKFCWCCEKWEGNVEICRWVCRGWIENSLWLKQFSVVESFLPAEWVGSKRISIFKSPSNRILDSNIFGMKNSGNITRTFKTFPFTFAPHKNMKNEEKSWEKLVQSSFEWMKREKAIRKMDGFAVAAIFHETSNVWRQTKRGVQQISSHMTPLSLKTRKLSQENLGNVYSQEWGIIPFEIFIAFVLFVDSLKRYEKINLQLVISLSLPSTAPHLVQDKCERNFPFSFCNVVNILRSWYFVFHGDMSGFRCFKLKQKWSFVHAKYNVCCCVSSLSKSFRKSSIFTRLFFSAFRYRMEMPKGDSCMRFNGMFSYICLIRYRELFRIQFKASHALLKAD
jgi:hypothetical protein